MDTEKPINIKYREQLPEENDIQTENHIEMILDIQMGPGNKVKTL